MSGDPIFPKLLFLAVLTLVNAFFAAAEIAVISLPEEELRRRAGAGDRGAAKLLKLARDPDRFLSAIQIAITLAGFLSSAFAAGSFSAPLTAWLMEDCGVAILDAHTLNSVTVLLITLALSYFSLVLGELAPKRIAMRKPEEVARLAIGPVCVLAAVFRPLVWLLSRSTDGVLRLLRVDSRTEPETAGREEIPGAAAPGREAVEPSERNPAPAAGREAGG